MKKLTRRDAVRIGALAPLGWSLGDALRAAESTGDRGPSKKSAIVVWLGGGPSHLDTFDMKPDAPEEIRGEFASIPTSVEGTRVCELLPNLAKRAGDFAILNGVSHTLAGHQLGTSYLSTGNRPVPSLEYPGYGAVVSRELPGANDLPHFVAVPRTPQTAGYLGVRYAPLQTNEVPRFGQPFGVRGLSLADGTTAKQFEERQRLLDRVDTAFEELRSRDALVDGLDRFDQQAFEVLSSPKAREAFDTGREKPEVAESFGQQGFGQSCLLAMRLVAAGVRFVTVTFSGWDTHSGHFKKSRESLLPQLDTGLAALLGGLNDRGLLETTTVLVTGEFGRTPKINERAGRDHWPRAFSVLMAGGGILGGQVVGASDEHGQGPAGEPITPDQVAHTFYASLGIDATKEYHTASGRPVMIVRHGETIPGLL